MGPAPGSRTDRHIALFEPDAESRKPFCDRMAAPGVTITKVESAAQLLALMQKQKVDLIVAAPQLPDRSLAALAEEVIALPAEKTCPLLVSVVGKTAKEESARWSRLANEFNLRLVDSPERLIDEATLMLCRPLKSLAEPTQQSIQKLHDPAKLLANKKVLIVDDDIRNIFALTSVLERYDVETLRAETGQEAIRQLQSNPDVDIVLMDIMMPEMDGNDTTRAIRQMSQFRNLPIVAVTAKAMKGDREKCLEAGAWDYLSKPVDPAKMLSVLRAWIAG